VGNPIHHLVEDSVLVLPLKDPVDRFAKQFQGLNNVRTLGALLRHRLLGFLSLFVGLFLRLFVDLLPPYLEGVVQLPRLIGREVGDHLRSAAPEEVGDRFEELIPTGLGLSSARGQPVFPNHLHFVFTHVSLS